MAENQQPRGRAHSCCGNGGPGKSWKCPNPTFPRFPPPLKIPHKTRDSHIPTAPATADRFHTQQRKAAKIEEFYRFSPRTLKSCTTWRNTQADSTFLCLPRGTPPH